MHSATVSVPPESPSAAPHPRRFVALMVFVLGILAATGPLATDMYLPAFPQIAADLNAPESMVQLTLTSMMVGLAVGQIVIGPMSDAWGRRIPLLVGIAVFTLASFLCTLITSAEAFIVLRFLQGLAGAAGAVISRAVVRDLFEGDDVARFFSRLMLIIGVAPLLGPTLGSQLLLFGPWQLLFVALGVASARSFVLVMFWLPESLPAERRSSQRPAALARTFVALIRDSAFLAPTMVLAVSFGMMFTYIAAFSFVSQNEFGATAQQYGMLFAFNACGLIGGTQLNALLIGRVETTRRLLAGLVTSVLAVAGLGALAFTGEPSLPTLIALLFVMMAGMGFVFPNATTMAVASQRPEIAGTASALIGSLQFALGGGIAALAGLTPTGEATLVSMATVMLASGTAAILVYVWGARRAYRAQALR